MTTTQQAPTQSTFGSGWGFLISLTSFFAQVACFFTALGNSEDFDPSTTSTGPLVAFVVVLVLTFLFWGLAVRWRSWGAVVWISVALAPSAVTLLSSLVDALST